MGKSSQTTRENMQQSTGAWKPAQPLLKDILGQAQGLMPSAATTDAEARAIQGLAGNAGNATQYLPQVQGLASDLFAGGGMGTGAQSIRDAAKTAMGGLNPIAQGNFVDPTKNPILQNVIGQTQSDIANRVGSAFAGSGRSFSGAHMNALGEGIGDATNRAYLDSYNTERNRQMQALGMLPEIAMGTSGALDQAAGNVLGARGQGIGVGATATGMQDDPYLRTLEAEGMRRGLPIQNLGMLSNLILPVAQTGRETTGQRTSTTESQQNPWQTAAGAALGGLGLLGGAGPFGATGAFGAGGMFGSRAARPSGFSPFGFY